MIAQSLMEKVLEKWRNEGVDALAPIEESAIRAALEKTGRRYSLDVLALYSVTGGMPDGVYDSHMWNLWSPDRVVSENINYKNRGHLLFADFLIDSHFYCFRYENEDRSVVCVDYSDDDAPEQIAESVDEFLILYLSKPRKLQMLD